jgi:GT2 family glycosyltransferase/glycosyltransferase involved in cell wall biosynthesis
VQFDRFNPPFFMFETDFCHFHIDQPQDWNFTGETADIRGWIYAKNGEELSDVRVRLDGVITYGIMGLDRPDIRTFFKGTETAQKSGFRITLRPWRNARHLVFETLRADAVWTKFHQVEVNAVGEKMPAAQPRPKLRTEVLEESLYYLYRHFHYASREDLRNETRRVLAEISVNFTEMFPENDLIGYLDLPQHWVNAHYEKFRVSGWAFSRDQTISRLAATIGCVNENRLIWGKEREDVLHHNPSFPQALKSAYYGLVDVAADSFSPACLKIFVDYPDAPRQLLRSRRLFINKLDENSGPIPIFSEVKFAQVAWRFLREISAGHYTVESWWGWWRAIRSTRRKLAEKMIHSGQRSPALPAVVTRAKEPYDLWVHHNRLTPRLLSFLQKEGQAAAHGPKISLIVPTYNTPTAFLDELIASVQSQVYLNWELCIADDASPQPHVARQLSAASAKDGRIKHVVRETNGHISAATNSALALATGDYVAFLDHDDLLPADALLHVAEAILGRPSVDLLYTDEDKIDATGRRYDAQLKGGWSPDMAITHNYVHHLTVIRRKVVEKVEGLRLGYEGAQDIDLILRCVELIDNADILHVPFVCYHWRAHEQSTASKGDQKGYLFDAARRGIADALKRRGLRAEPFLPRLMKDYALCLHQVRWDPTLLAENAVTIVIPTKNRADLLGACIRSLDQTVNWQHAQLVIVDDGSTESDAVELLVTLEARKDLRVRVIRTGEAAAAFNYSRLVNLGTAAAQTPLVLHLNNDIEALEAGWLEDLVGWLSVPGVGVVGARLVRRDDTLDHAGIWVAPEGGLADAMFAGLDKDDLGYLFLPHAARNVTAVTGACLLTRVDLYRQLGGFDEVDFQVAYNDVDYCLRVARAGLRTVYSPQATLRHLGSASRGNTYTEQEHLAFVRRYPNFRDSHVSEVTRLARPSFKLNSYDHRFSRRPLKLRVAVVTHNLRLEGAPLFIVEYARYLAHHEAWDVRVYSPTEGPLREKFEQAGIPVEVLDLEALLKAPAAADFRREVTALAERLDWKDVDLIVGNTMLSYWVVPLGQQWGIPAAIYIHESNTPRRFFSEHNLASPEVIPLIEDAIRDASRVVFIAEASRKIFAELNVHDNFRLINSWIDVERIEEFMAKHDRATLRRKHHVNQNATVVVNVGSVCQRKGQHIFIRAIDHLMKQSGDALQAAGPLEFIMVGAREGLYLETIEQDIELMGITNARLVPETFDVYDWYRLADIFVCTSFEESFPRVLLEAATFRLPVVSTNVDGIPEMFVANDEAYLIGAGDYHKLAATMKMCLDRHFAGDTKMISMAYTRVSRFYDARISLPAHVAMAREAYFG